MLCVIQYANTVSAKTFMNPSCAKCFLTINSTHHNFVSALIQCEE
jgi:hypothetical protein